MMTRPEIIYKLEIRLNSKEMHKLYDFEILEDCMLGDYLNADLYDGPDNTGTYWFNFKTRRDMERAIITLKYLLGEYDEVAQEQV